MLKSLSSTSCITYKLMRSVSLAALLTAGLVGCGSLGTVKFGDEDVNIGSAFGDMFISPGIGESEFVELGQIAEGCNKNEPCKITPNSDLRAYLEGSFNKNKDHIFAINKRGIYMPACLLDKLGEKCTDSQPGWEGNKIFFSTNYRDEESKNQKEYIDKFADKLIEELKAVNKPEKRLLIFVHGGLNVKSDWLKKVASAYRISKDNNSNVHNVPLFIDWRSGPLTTYWDQLAKYDQGDIDTVYKKLTAPIYLAGDIISGVGNTLPILGKLSERWFTANAKSEDIIPWCNNRDLNLYCKGVEQTKLPLWEKGERDAYLYLNPVKLAFPLLSGVGKQAWENMLLRTRTLYHTPDEFDSGEIAKKCLGQNIELSEACKERIDTNGKGALYILLSRLREKLKEENIGITLIGHSMGAIVSNQMLLEFPDLPYKEIVYMAGADSVNNTRMALMPAMRLKENQKLKFYNLSLHPLAESTEVSGGGFASSGSLLEWIDYILTTPKNPLDRTVGKWENIVDTAHTFPKELRNRIAFKRFALSNKPNDACGNDDMKANSLPDKCDPMVHGDFSNPNIEFWKPAFWTTEDMPEHMRNPFATPKTN